jgi:hypothetical protein
MVTREQLVTAEIIALEDARRMAAALHSQAQEEGEERIRAAVQRPPALPARTSTQSDPADSSPTSS